MRMLVHAKMPHEPFNSLVRNGTVGKILDKYFETIKPESIYFTEYNGQRGCIMIVDVADPTKVPVIAEPLFLSFNAAVEFHVVMSPEELGKAGLEALGKQWA
jgi:hypothetical protein